MVCSVVHVDGGCLMVLLVYFCCFLFFFFKQKAAYEITVWLEFSRVLFRSQYCGSPVITCTAEIKNVLVGELQPYYSNNLRTNCLVQGFKINLKDI